MKPVPGRTINPLHFEDLEPHRFEDLVRQLIYDLREWVALEAIGRAGADDGVDIRGIEALPSASTMVEIGAQESDVADEPEIRTWFIQCKREKAFGPSKARAVADAAIGPTDDPPHGFMLVAPCDLSKRTREALETELRARGVRHVVCWGRGELEDQLYLPRNDHLLFAYFGISLQVRRRSQTTDLRNRLAKKRQVFKAMGGLDHRGWTAVLVRDPSEVGYPFRERVEDFDSDNPPWMWTGFRHHSNPDTLALVIRRHHAWISKDHKKYDVIDSCSHVVPHRKDLDKVPERDEEGCDRLWRYFNTEVPKEERAWLEVVGWIPLDDILLVDDLGDVFNEPPHILVARGHQHGFFAHTRAYIQIDDHTQHEKRFPVDELKKVKLFPDPIPDVEQSLGW